VTQATLTHEDVDQALSAQRGWRRDGDALVRHVRVRDFDEGLRFLERVAEVANDYGRRPDMCISEFNRLRLSVSNLHHAGFTQAEMRLVAKVNDVIRDDHPEAWAESE
jgi:4a-hydroxytetrahydrobiopterin dehydratase